MIGPRAIVDGTRERYQIIREIGSGGVGTVFLGRNISSSTQVALKFLHGSRFPVTDTSRERLYQEIKAATEEISSDYIIAGLDYGIFNEEPFLVMEWMSGGTLAAEVSLASPVDP